MTRRELAMGSVTFLAVIALGFVSATSVDRHYAAATAEMPSQTPSASSSACVSADGSWKNWVWENVPTLSPKCE
jgi:hypothetical protein